MSNELIERIDTILSEAATDDEARVVTLLQIIKESLSKQEAQEPVVYQCPRCAASFAPNMLKLTKDQSNEHR